MFKLNRMDAFFNLKRMEAFFLNKKKGISIEAKVNDFY